MLGYRLTHIQEANFTLLDTTFPPWPAYSEEEGEAVKKVVLSNRVNYWTGEETRRFEDEFAHYVGCKHAIGLANGTLALDLALKAIGVGPGDEVVVTPRSFIASASCVVTAGGIPVFADVDAESQNLSVDTIRAVLTPRTKAVIVVHLAGMPADMDSIMRLAKEHDFRVIEDCAQAHGASYKGRSVGSIGDIGAWSFCQDKIMTTGGEGGLVTTNSKALWSAMWSYKDHGKSWDVVQKSDHPPGYRWLHESFGTNWRMTELQGVLGRIQLARLQRWNEARCANANQIWDTCRQIEWLRVPDVSSSFVHAAYKAYVFIRPERLPPGWSRDSIIKSLLEQGIPAYSGSCSEIYLEKAFQNSGFRPPHRLPVAKELGETSLMFLVHPTLEPKHLNMTCDALEHVARLIKNEKCDEIACLS